MQNSSSISFRIVEFILRIIGIRRQAVHGGQDEGGRKPRRQESGASKGSKPAPSAKAKPIIGKGKIRIKVTKKF